MAKDFKQNGLSIFECLLALLLLQVLIWGAYPSLMALIEQKQSSTLMYQLQSSIDWARWMAVIRHEKISLKPMGQWQNGWQIFVNDQPIKVVRVRNAGRISIQWHGFSGKGDLTFYPKMLSNHLNGYFQIGHQQLWINRLGHMRVAYGI